MDLSKNLSAKASSKFLDVKLTIVYDTNPFVTELQRAWGFACVAEVGETKVLFDTGRDGNILLENMRKTGIDPESIDLVLISNILNNHMGGLLKFVGQNPRVPIYIPNSFPEEICKKINDAGGNCIRVTAAKQFCPNIFTLGELRAFFNEQVLAIRTQKGLVLVTGCARPGIKAIWSAAKTLFPDEPIYLVLGGLHLSRLSNSDIAKKVKEFQKLAIRKIAPLHCSGQDARKLFERAFGKNYIKMGVGGRVHIEA